MRIRFFSYVRTLGLTLVLLYHFYPRLLPGGFIGVDVFFTFSGYLITALAIHEIEIHKQFNLKRFAERRFFRIFPTIFFSMLIVLPLTLLGSSDLRYNLRQQVFAGLGFISNIYEASTKISYANNFAPHIFVHLWSLAIEVQFYVIWGLIIWLFSRRNGQKIKRLLLITSCVIFTMSLGLMIGWSYRTNDLSALYYSSFAHVFPFFMGAIIATVAGLDSTKFIEWLKHRLTLTEVIFGSILSASTLGALSLSLSFNDKITYKLGFLEAGFSSVLLILFLRILHEKTDREESKPIRIIADVSYGMYIFHWPLLIIFKSLLHNYTQAVLLTIILSFVLSAVMFYWIDPILRGRRRIIWPFVAPEGIIVAALFLISTMALQESTNTTTLNETLWQGAAMQSQQQFQLDNQKLTVHAQGVTQKKNQSGRDVIVIGDSVTMGARPTLMSNWPNAFIDAAGDRKIGELPDTLTNYKKNNNLRKNVVLALGTNSVDPRNDIATLKMLIKQYSSKYHLILVTPADWGTGGPFNSDKVADWEIRYKNKYKNVTVADWRGASHGKHYFNADGIHITDDKAAQLEWFKVVNQAVNK